MKCNKCGSEHVARILYGFPKFGTQLESDIAEKKIVLGGCVVSENDPKWHCFSCGEKFGKPPVIRKELDQKLYEEIVSKYGKSFADWCAANERRKVEQYKDIVTEIRFSWGGFFGGYQIVSLERQGETILVSANANTYKDHEGFQRQGTSAELDNILTVLFDELFIHEEAIAKIGGTMPEDLPTPKKSISQIEREQLKQLKKGRKKLMLDE